MFSRNACRQKDMGVVTINHSTVDFTGNNTFDDNLAESETISVSNMSTVEFRGITSISRNRGGPGINSVRSSIALRDNTVMCDNFEGGINSSVIAAIHWQYSIL